MKQEVRSRHWVGHTLRSFHWNPHNNVQRGSPKHTHIRELEINNVGTSLGCDLEINNVGRAWGRDLKIEINNVRSA